MEKKSLQDLLCDKCLQVSTGFLVFFTCGGVKYQTVFLIIGLKLGVNTFFFCLVSFSHFIPFVGLFCRAFVSCKKLHFQNN